MSKYDKDWLEPGKFRYNGKPKKVPYEALKELLERKALVERLVKERYGEEDGFEDYNCIRFIRDPSESDGMSDTERGNKLGCQCGDCPCDNCDGTTPCGDSGCCGCCRPGSGCGD